MMKVAIALCVLFAVSQAAHTTNWYSGSVNATGTPQAAVAVDTAAATCTPLAAVTGYRNFTVNVTSAGFFFFTALFEKTFVSTAQLQVYSGAFAPATPCGNLVYAQKTNGYVPHIEFVQYLTPGLYPVVVTGANPLNLGLFAIHVDAATLNGATNEVTGAWWYAPNPQTVGSDCVDSSYPAPYTTFNFYQNGTVSADILFFGYNNSVGGSWDFSAAVYNSSSSSLAFVGTGNRTNPASACGTNNFVYSRSTDESDLDFNLQNNYTYQAAAIIGVTLNNGLNYSVVIGTYDSTVFSANFGVFVRTTFLGNLGATTDFVAPDVPALGTTTDCTPETNKYYGVNWFTAIYNAYILDNPRSGFFDTAGCLYRGLNIGNATAPPANCPGNVSHIAFIQCGDTGDGGPVANFLIPGVNYTWIQFPYSGTGTAGSKYLLYNYSGKLLGNAPVTTTAPATTGAEASSSSASSVVVMLALYIAAMFF